MRMTLNLPEGLLEEARALLGFESKTDPVVFALKEIVRRKRFEDLRQLMGSVDLRLNLAGSRRRSGYGSNPGSLQPARSGVERPRTRVAESGRAAGPFAPPASGGYDV